MSKTQTALVSGTSEALGDRVGQRTSLARSLLRGGIRAAGAADCGPDYPGADIDGVHRVKLSRS